MPFQRINGIQIYYEEHGKGDPVLLIQGLGYPSGMWFLQISDLSRHFRTIVFDNRGVGRSDKPDEEFSVALMASDAMELLRALGIGKAHMVGISLGGYIAQEMTLQQPERVDRLVLLATTCGGPEYLELTKDLWSETAAFRNLPPDEMIRKGMALAAAPGFAQNHPELIERGVRVRSENLQPLYAFSRQAAAAYLFNSKDRAHLIHCPTLILAGAQDRVMPLPLTQVLAGIIPKARLKVYPDAGHLLFLEKAKEINQAIVDFLRGENEGSSW
jgi:pimeloyl-ACP methyl ester carboxylesterase